MKIYKVKLYTILATFFSCSFYIFNTVSYAIPNVKDHEHNEQNAPSPQTYDIANFANATGPTVNGRTWYSNIVTIKINKMLLVSGGNNNDWSSFGINPGWNRTNGSPIITSGYSVLHVDMNGSASQLKLQIYDKSDNKYEVWTTDGLSFDWNLPKEIIDSGFISKLQFVSGPGNVDLMIKRIYLTN